MRRSVRDFAPGEGLAAGAAAGEAPGEGWIDVAVPGDVHRALVDAGRIEDPFYDRNEDACAWMEEREWWYRLSFDGPEAAGDERLRLVFHGLDTYATVYLNGEKLGEHANMFRRPSSTSQIRCSRAARTSWRSASTRRWSTPARAIPSSGGATLRSAPRCARPSSATAGTGARGCPRSASGARSSCAASCSRRSAG